MPCLRRAWLSADVSIVWPVGVLLLVAITTEEQRAICVTAAAPCTSSAHPPPLSLLRAPQLLVNGHAVYLPAFMCGHRDYDILSDLCRDLDARGEGMVNWSKVLITLTHWHPLPSHTGTHWHSLPSPTCTHYPHPLAFAAIAHWHSLPSPTRTHCTHLLALTTFTHSNSLHSSSGTHCCTITRCMQDSHCR
jgi:hypothetical protein